MKHTLFSYLAIIILAAACTTDDVISPATDPPANYVMEISATRQAPDADADTRAQYTFNQSGGSYSWEGDEEIGLFILNAGGQTLHSNLKFTAVPGSLSDSKASVRFTGTIPGGQPPRGSTYYAVYPYSADCTFTPGGDQWIDARIPSRQTATRPPMLASAIDGDSDDGQTLAMNFNAMCSFAVLSVKFTASDSDWDTNISEVRIRPAGQSDSGNKYTHVYPSPRKVGNSVSIPAYIMTKEFTMASPSGSITVDVLTPDGWVASKTFRPDRTTEFTRNRAVVLPEVTIDKADFHYTRINDNSQPTYNMQGDGTAANPFRLVSSSQLLGMAAFLEDKDDDKKHVRLEIDIDIQTTRWTPLAASWGTVFDGNYLTISGKMINREYEGDYGLFGGLAYCTVKNLEIAADIEASMSRLTGALVGYVAYTTLENCTFSGKLVHGGANAYCIGGLGGDMGASNMKNCKMTGSIRVNNNPQMILIGGLAGRMNIHESAHVSGNEISGSIEVPTGILTQICAAPVAGMLSGPPVFCKIDHCFHCRWGATCDGNNPNCICGPKTTNTTIQDNLFTGTIYYETSKDATRHDEALCHEFRSVHPHPHHFSGNVNRGGTITCVVAP